MGQMITKPDANPIIFAVCNWLGLGGLGYFLMGQKKKAIIAWIATILLGVITCGVGYMIIFVFAYDAYLLGQKLQSGQAIGENENGLSFLNAIFKD
jgi:TM2 domain-containing membrane protein YozV